MGWGGSVNIGMPSWYGEFCGGKGGCIAGIGIVKTGLFLY